LGESQGLRALHRGLGVTHAVLVLLPGDAVDVHGLAVEGLDLRREEDRHPERPQAHRQLEFLRARRLEVFAVGAFSGRREGTRNGDLAAGDDLDSHEFLVGVPPGIVPLTFQELEETAAPGWRSQDTASADDGHAETFVGGEMTLDEVGRNRDVVVDEEDDVPAGGPIARVPRRGRTAVRPAEEADREAGRGGTRTEVGGHGRAVVHHDQLRGSDAVEARAQDRVDGVAEQRPAVVGRHHDAETRGGAAHSILGGSARHAVSLPFPARSVRSAPMTTPRSWPPSPSQTAGPAYRSPIVASISAACPRFAAWTQGRPRNARGSRRTAGKAPRTRLAPIERDRTPVMRAAARNMSQLSRLTRSSQASAAPTT